MTDSQGHHTIEVVQHSSQPYQGRLIRLRVDEVTLPNGKPSRREVVVHPGAVAVVAMPDPESVLLVRQYRHAAQATLWEIPAGTLEAGEAPASCAARELEEETGHRAERLEKIYEVFVAPGYCTERVHGYLATGLVRTAAKTEEDEFLSVETVRLDRAMEMIERMEIRDAKTLCGLFCVARRLR